MLHVSSFQNVKIENDTNGEISSKHNEGEAHTKRKNCICLLSSNWECVGELVGVRENVIHTHNKHSTVLGRECGSSCMLTLFSQYISY